MSERQPTLLRHERRARLAHLLLAVLVLALVVSGLGMGGRLPGSLTALLGGHERLAAWHRQLGLVFGVCFLTLPLVAGGRLRQMLVEMVRFHRDELRWFFPFFRYCLRPHRHEPPLHDGRYDPAQRIVFLLLGSSLLVCTLSGLVLYVAPPQQTLLLGWAIRVHVGASVVLIASAALHVLAGSGLLPSHRGVARVMFGDGRVPVALASRLWPGWTARQVAPKEQRGALVNRSSRRPKGALAPAAVKTATAAGKSK
ncbi:MAG: cytochrome b/b6 domain-containing protein [Chloroflexota bacterium]|nr:cytochrome b/b6 domain-containing protein [Chloroflexota bacterium]